MEIEFHWVPEVGKYLVILRDEDNSGIHEIHTHEMSLEDAIRLDEIFKNSE